MTTSCPSFPSAQQPRQTGRWFLLAAVPLCLVLAQAWRSNVPAHPGADQNAYLVAGKLMAGDGGGFLLPTEDYHYHSPMWIQPGAVAWPKYPLGLPCVYAVVWALGGPVACYWVSPVCMGLALGGLVVLAGRLGLLWPGLAAGVTLSFAPAIQLLAVNPNAHAAAMCAGVWGLVALLRWADTGAPWRGVLAGLLLGAAVTIRYTEVLLLLPLLVVAGQRWHQRLPRARREGLLLLAAWGLLPALLVVFNLAAFGTLTGYGPTAESSPGWAFGWGHLVQHLPGLWRDLNALGLPLLLPMVPVALALLWWLEHRLAWLLLLWGVPPLLLAAAYYWDPPAESLLGHARLSAGALPPLVLAVFAAFGCLARRWLAARWPAAILAVALAAGSAGMGVRTGSPLVRADRAARQQVLARGERLRAEIRRAGLHEPGVMLICPDPALLNDLQFRTPMMMVDAVLLSPPQVRAMLAAAPTEGPGRLDPGRRQVLQRLAAVRDPLTELRRQSGRRTILLAALQGAVDVPSLLRAGSQRLGQWRETEGVWELWREAPWDPGEELANLPRAFSALWGRRNLLEKHDMVLLARVPSSEGLGETPSCLTPDARNGSAAPPAAATSLHPQRRQIGGLGRLVHARHDAVESRQRHAARRDDLDADGPAVGGEIDNQAAWQLLGPGAGVARAARQPEVGRHRLALAECHFEVGLLHDRCSGQSVR